MIQVPKTDAETFLTRCAMPLSVEDRHTMGLSSPCSGVTARIIQECGALTDTLHYPLPSGYKSAKQTSMRCS